MRSAVVAPRVDHHVRRLGHVAIDAQSARLRAVGMMVVDRRIVLAGRMLAEMAPDAHAVVDRAAPRRSGVDALKPGRMGIVTVGAANLPIVHLALQKRPVLIVFFPDLAVGIVQVAIEQFREVVIEELPAAAKAGIGHVAAGMARGTAIDFRAGIAALEVRQSEAVAAVPKVSPRLGQFDVQAARPVTRLATDVDLRPGGMITIGRQVVVLLQIGRVAVGTHVVPVLQRPRPMQHVGVRDRLVGIEVEPASTLGVPGQRQALHAAGGKRHEILLQRPNAERVADVERFAVAGRPIGRHAVLVAAAEQLRGDAEMSELLVVEIPPHGLRRGHRHRLFVIGTEPSTKLLGMAAVAPIPAHIMGRQTLRLAKPPVGGQQSGRQQQCQQRRHDEAAPGEKVGGKASHGHAPIVTVHGADVILSAAKDLAWACGRRDPSLRSG